MNARLQQAFVATCVGLLLTAAGMDAQEPVAAPITTPPHEALTAAERRSAVNGALARASDPTMRSSASGPTPTLLLEAGATSKTAGARVGLQIGDLLLDVKLQGLVDSTSGQAPLADLGGLRNKSTAEFGIVWTRYPRLVERRVLEAACAAYEMASRHAIGPAACTLPALRAVGRRASADAPGGAAARLVDGVVRLLAPRRIVLAGVSYKVGPEQFTFSSTPTAAGTSASRVNWSVSARAGVVTSQSLSFGAEYTHEMDYDASERRQICVPKDDGILECFDRVIGAPARRHREIARVEVRKLIGPTIAINPRVSVNVRSAAIGFEVPVYFLRAERGGLAGGVTLGWRHSPAAGSAVEVTAFVGQVFNLILK